MSSDPRGITQWLGRLRSRIAVRIAVPFVVLHVCVLGLAAAAAAALVARSIDRSLDAQARRASAMLVDSGFALDVTFLGHVRSVVGAESVSFRSDGTVLASTLPPDEAKRFTTSWTTNAIAQGATYWSSGQPYHVGVRELSSRDARPPSLLALLLPESASRELRRSIWLVIIGTGAASAIVLVFVGTWLGRGMARPLEELAVAADRVLSDTARAPVPVTRTDEIGRLAEAFNRMTSELRRYEDQLARSERLVAAGRIAAGLAHEIRNPLSSIRMLVQLACESHGLDARGKESLAVVLAEAERLETTVANLLDVARPAEHRAEPLDPRTLLRDVQMLVGRRFEHQGIALSCSIADEVPPSIRADRARMKQALLNLVINGAEAMPEGGALTVGLAPLPAGGVRFTVEDEGEGIVEAVARRLFEPFATTKPDGVGMGLYITRRIVEEHGGRVSLVGRDRGAVATIELPSAAEAGENSSHG